MSDGRTEVDRDELGGDPPCWAELVNDHRDGNPPLDPDGAPPAGPYAERAKAHAGALMAVMAKRLFGFTWVAPVPAPATLLRIGP
jgi:hypothetical protein